LCLPVSFTNLHLTTVGHSLPYRIVALPPIICLPWMMQWMVGGGDLGWPSSCGDGFECGHHVGWFRVEHGGAPRS
jgi:hypothetical protein